MNKAFKPVAAILVGAAILGAIGVAVAIPLGFFL